MRLPKLMLMFIAGFLLFLGTPHLTKAYTYKCPNITRSSYTHIIDDAGIMDKDYKTLCDIGYKWQENGKDIYLILINVPISSDAYLEIYLSDLEKQEGLYDLFGKIDSSYIGFAATRDGRATIRLGNRNLYPPYVIDRMHTVLESEVKESPTKAFIDSMNQGLRDLYNTIPPTPTATPNPNVTPTPEVPLTTRAQDWVSSNFTLIIVSVLIIVFIVGLFSLPYIANSLSYWLDDLSRKKRLTSEFASLMAEIDRDLTLLTLFFSNQEIWAEIDSKNTQILEHMKRARVKFDKCNDLFHTLKNVVTPTSDDVTEAVNCLAAIVGTHWGLNSQNIEKYLDLTAGEGSGVGFGDEDEVITALNQSITKTTERITKKRKPKIVMSAGILDHIGKIKDLRIKNHQSS